MDFFLINQVACILFSELGSSQFRVTQLKTFYSEICDQMVVIGF